jgi:hypothetical protein
MFFWTSDSLPLLRLVTVRPLLVKACPLLVMSRPLLHNCDSLSVQEVDEVWLPQGLIRMHKCCLCQRGCHGVSEFLWDFHGQSGIQRQ